ASRQLSGTKMAPDRTHAKCSTTISAELRDSTTTRSPFGLPSSARSTLAARSMASSSCAYVKRRPDVRSRAASLFGDVRAQCATKSSSKGCSERAGEVTSTRARSRRRRRRSATAGQGLQRASIRKRDAHEEATLAPIAQRVVHELHLVAARQRVQIPAAP